MFFTASVLVLFDLVAGTAAIFSFGIPITIFFTIFGIYTTMTINTYYNQYILLMFAVKIRFKKLNQCFKWVYLFKQSFKLYNVKF